MEKAIALATNCNLCHFGDRLLNKPVNETSVGLNSHLRPELGRESVTLMGQLKAMRSLLIG